MVMKGLALGRNRMIGGGIPLFANRDRGIELQHIASQAYCSEFMQGTYRVAGAAG
jgi:hypothetical protein